MIGSLASRCELVGCAVALASTLCLPGCFLSPFPDLRSPADFARPLMARCASFSEESSARLLDASLVESVEPSYAFVSSGPIDRQARLRGARVHLRPIAGLSRETLQRTLECHQARVVLGSAPSSEQDPYSLPGTWLAIEADSEGDGFVVSVSAEGLPEARRVLERARRFALGRR